jgi:hypothetical protein
MKRTLLLLLIVVILITTTSIVFAKSGQKMELVCWTTPKGIEQSAYFMTTGNGIVHRFKEDGQHDIYKPVSEFDMPGEGGWEYWTAKSHAPCTPPTSASHGQLLVPGAAYWHKHN